MLFAHSRKQFPSFWTIQIVGWLLYLVAVYITFLTVVAPENYLNLFWIKAFRSLIGFCLTCILRFIYKRFVHFLSIQLIVLLVLFCAVVFGCVWTAIEIYYYYLTENIFNLSANLARSPSYALDYAMTLTAWSALYFGVKTWWSWQREHEKTLEASALANKAQVEMLRYQLNPHFLFNALNSVRALIEEDQSRAKQMITQLSEFLQYSLLGGDEKEARLSKEIEAARNYLAIEKIRFERKLEVSFEVEREAEDFRVPCFLLNPLVENAVKHGFENDSRLKIRIAARVSENALQIEVSNTGNLQNNHRTNGAGIGLKNIRERLEKLFPQKSSFQLCEENGWVRAKIEIEK
jgi:sensor histidine kinase YesM